MKYYDVLRKLHETYGPAGDEGGIRDVIRDLASPYADEITTDVMGNLIVRKRGDGPKLMFCAHMDSVGFVVTHITDEGYLHCAKLGGVTPGEALYTPLRFKSGLRGVLVKDGKAKLEELRIDECLIDVGAKDRDEAQKLVQLGDTAVYDTPLALSGKRAVGPYMDDHSACAVLLCALEQVSRTPNDVYFVFSTQEELGLRGAKTAAYAIQPDYGVVLDVTDTGDMPGAETAGTAKLGGGAAVKVMDRSVICHPQMIRTLERLAGEKGVTFQRDVIASGGTDAGVIRTTGAGAITGGISIPCRYIHTPAEMIDLDDAEHCVRLTAAMAQAELEKL